MVTWMPVEAMDLESFQLSACCCWEFGTVSWLEWPLPTAWDQIAVPKRAMGLGGGEGVP